MKCVSAPESPPLLQPTLHLTQFFVFSLCHVEVVSLDSSVSIQHRIHNSYASLVPCFTYIYSSSSYLPWGPESRQAWKLVEWMQEWAAGCQDLVQIKVMIHVTVTARELPIRNDFLMGFYFCSCSEEGLRDFLKDSLSTSQIFLPSEIFVFNLILYFLMVSQVVQWAEYYSDACGLSLYSYYAIYGMLIKYCPVTHIYVYVTHDWN